MNETVTIGQGTARIEARAFEGNLKLCSAIVADGVEFIGEGAFRLCGKLKRIYLPESVKTIEKDAFALCPALEIFCEGERGEDWVEKRIKETVVEEVVTPEDDAFNFHRSSGGFTSHTYEREIERHISWNPEKRPVHENVSKEEFVK